MKGGIFGFHPIFHRSIISFSRSLTLATKGSRIFISLNLSKRMFNSSPGGIVAKYIVAGYCLFANAFGFCLKGNVTVYFRGRPKLSRKWYKKLKVFVVVCSLFYNMWLLDLDDRKGC